MNKWLLSAMFVFVVASESVFAFNEDFLTYSPVSYFTQQDIKLYLAAKNQALTQARDGEKVSWSNPQSGAHGYFMPSNTTTKNGLTCRQLKISNVANKVPGESSYRVCKINNIWKVVG